MTPTRRAPSLAEWIAVSVLTGVVAGILLIMGLRSKRMRAARAPLSAQLPGANLDLPKSQPPAKPTSVARSVERVEADRPDTATSPIVAGDADVVKDLRKRDLLVPVAGVTTQMLRDSFSETRDRVREHEAVDILAPRGTPVRRGGGRHYREILHERPRRADDLPVRSVRDERVLLRAPWPLRARIVPGRPRHPRSDDWIRRHHRQRACQHATSALLDLSPDGEKAMVAGRRQWADPYKNVWKK